MTECSPTVFVGDDDPAIRESLTRLLSAAGDDVPHLTAVQKIP